MANLAEGIQGLVQHMRAEQQMVRDWVESQAEQQAAIQKTLDRLTDRELEVFESIGRGLSARDIGTNLGISAKTVDAHRARIREKLGFSDSSKLLRYAVRWVETDPNSSRIF